MVPLHLFPFLVTFTTSRRSIAVIHSQDVVFLLFHLNNISIISGWVTFFNFTFPHYESEKFQLLLSDCKYPLTCAFIFPETFLSRSVYDIVSVRLYNNISAVSSFLLDCQHTIQHSLLVGLLLLYISHY